MKFYGMILAFLFSVQIMWASEVSVAVSSKERGSDEFKGVNIFDGKMETRWSSEFKDKQKLQIVLPKAIELKSMEIIWEGSYATNYKLKVSEDKNKWTLIHSQKGKTDSSSDMIKLQKTKNIRYINMELYKRSSQYGFSIFEIKLNGKILKNILKDNGIENYKLVSLMIDEQDQKTGKTKQKTSSPSKIKEKKPTQKSAPLKPKKDGNLIYI